MNKNYIIDQWTIIEEGFHPNTLRASESIFSTGNGRIGQRGNFEESYTGDSLQGSYLAGISFMEPTRVGWWKNGYPRSYSRVPNAPNWSGIKLRLIDEELDLAAWDVDTFERRLHMGRGVLERTFTVTSPKGNRLSFCIERFYSMTQQDLCLIRYSVTSINYEGRISLIPYLNGDVSHESANFHEKMWNILRAKTHNEYAYLWTQTKQEDEQVCCAISHHFYKGNKVVTGSPIKIEREKSVGFSVGTDVKQGETIHLYKYTAIVSSLYCDRKELVETSVKKCLDAKAQGWNSLLSEHEQLWSRIWKEMDVQIDGDPAVQQAIRFNIFQLNQSYRGDDPRLNIGPKGFTGEKYGGNTQWNTELCCVPFFLLSSSQDISRNLLLYRYYHLKRAISNAEKLGFTGGAALYPMVTFDGRERHNEWEISFEEIHRNGIIAYAIDQYTRCTGKTDYVANYGLEVLIAISRFWSQRVTFSEVKKCYVLLGVTGPNEYEVNVNNNWYTNYICMQSLKQTLHYLDLVHRDYPEAYAKVIQKTEFNYDSEINRWQEIIAHIYLPEDSERGIFLQQDGYLDKELHTLADIAPTDRPINQHWSWDRILRSCFIKQSDVLLGIYLFSKNFSKETIRRNFEFYEPRTVHESSLSPFVHSILAARIGETEKAYDLFLRATRMDLDDYNNEVNEGLHITSMPGSWLALVEGFGGMELDGDLLCFNPIIPKQWNSYSFKINFRLIILQITVTPSQVKVSNEGEHDISIKVYNTSYLISKQNEVVFPI